jgi:hypothetical protein
MVAYHSSDVTLGTTTSAVQARVVFVSDDFWSAETTRARRRYRQPRLFSLLACGGPALRAALIDPVDALRSE